MNNQMNNAVRKIHNLLSSGAVTVTGPNQPRILKQKVGSTTVTSSNNLQQQQQLANSSNRCYVCDEALGASQAQHPLTEMQTSHTATKFPNKIGQLVGDAFMVIVSVEDVVCSRCTNLINYLDRLENDVERVRTNLMNLLHKKYGLNDEGGGSDAPSPPIKMLKLNSGGTVTRPAADDSLDASRNRKILHGGTDSPVANKQSPPVSAVQQIKISTQQQVQQQQLAAGAQTVQRKTTKIYKCLSCDYKTSDMRLFNTHYETCKHQNFQCKNCKKIFPNFGAMKQHMVREHNTPMDNTCSVCHYNFVNEAALRKHMEINHSTNVIVTSTTTIPASAAVAAAAPVASTDAIVSPPTTSLYACNHCQFKSTDKPLFDEHLRKHLSGVKPKPFKCRLCAQRFETREAATVHAKQHQPNYFKCGTCSMSFSKRELLVKHFEVHQQPATPLSQTQPQPVTTTVKQQTPAALTQKLLQETINEALSESVGPGGTADAGAAANNIRFFSCHICSLTFIQENYYNQHMETHRRGDKKGAVAVATTHSNNTSPLTTISAGAALLGDSGLSKVDEPSGVATSAHANSNTIGGAAGISEADIESIFEKMHSDKSDSGNADSIAASSAATTSTTGSASTVSGGKTGENLVITSQQSSGGITFNITIPQPDNATMAVNAEKSTEVSTAPVSVSIDMPVLDQPDEAVPEANSIKSEARAEMKSEVKDDNSESSSAGKTTSSASGPVSMPSLDDDNETQEDETVKTETSETSPADASQTDSKSVHDEPHRDEKPTIEKKEEVKKETESAGKDDTASSGEVGEESEHAERDAAADEGEAEANATEEMVAAGGNGDQQVAMELDEAMQAQVESGQIKFIINENGQLLQLDNHIITDADGNQILVQDPEQIQQLLQSVGVLQSGDGLDGEALQMMTDANGQMVLVQGENNETQLIDASLLNADGQLVIQQGQDGELGEGAHVIGEDGTRIPVSVSYTADGQPIVQVQQQVLEAASGEDAQHDVLEKDATAAATAAEDDAEPQAGDEDGGGGAANTAGSYFALEELMQPQSSDVKAAD